ncbi:MAG: NAD(P)-dependent oxidoreductase [Candidatus Omnitrophica bacterium]|nr:NAD(P)-dependent oxidoreductase [Candidatus Omnitrophota bacterium]MBU1997704.1 NAD(P)-dependent oxidoreductase [Candidatus Omnitrophota bacterium]MBU4333489.1 NAD(P)-dependent oxidoreductase [Candidatus Omnitrophota bacterium]
MKILITGANGFVGKTLVKRLITSEHDIYVLDIDFDGFEYIDKVKGLFQQDISRSFKLKEEFDFVFHLGAYNVTHVGETSSDKYKSVNVEGTANLLGSANIRNFVFLSTIKIYDHACARIDENAPLDPVNAYEKSKLDAEIICKEKFSGENLYIFRSVNIAGPGQFEKALIPVLFKNSISGQPLDVFAPRKSVIHLLYVEDIVDLFEGLLFESVKGSIYNLSSKEDICLDELAEMIVEITNSKSEILLKNDSPVIESKIIIDKVRKELGWTPKTDVKEILKLYYGSIKNY